MLTEPELERIAEILPIKLSVRKPPSIVPRLMNLQEAAVYMGRTPEAMQQMAERHAVPFTRVDTKLWLDKVELDKLIERRTE